MSKENNKNNKNNNFFMKRASLLHSDKKIEKPKKSK